MENIASHKRIIAVAVLMLTIALSGLPQGAAVDQVESSLASTQVPMGVDMGPDDDDDDDDSKSPCRPHCRILEL